MKHVSMWLAGFVMLFSAMAITNANAAEQCETLVAGQPIFSIKRFAL